MMNTLDAILSLCAILSCFALIIGAVNDQKTNVLEANDSIKAKTNALICAAVIDSMFANSASDYSGNINCKTQNNALFATQKNKTKTAHSIASTKKDTYLEVEKLEHYK